MKLIKKLICLSLPLLLCAGPARGQDLPDSFAMYGDGKDPSNNRVRVVDSVCLDTSRLTVIYSAYYRLYDGGFDRRHLTSLHVGDRYSLFNDIAQHVLSKRSYDLLDRHVRGEIGDYSVTPDSSGIPSYFYKSVMYDYGSDRLKVVVPDIWANEKAENGNFSYSLAHIYEEEVPALEWEMTGEHGTVASFDCQKAECDFRGRRWEAWFTPEIPVSEGPWKLKGLPGLILYARDTTGQYSFEAVSVTESHEPFYDYVYEHEDRTTYRRFKRYERSCFRWPKSFNEETTVYIVTGKGIEEADYRNWRMPYYPMEWP